MHIYLHTLQLHSPIIFLNPFHITKSKIYVNYISQDLHRNNRCYHCHKGTVPSIKDAIIHTGQKHIEKDVFVLKRQSSKPSDKIVIH